MPLKELLERNFGVKTRPIINPLVSEVATTVTKVLSNNPNRLSFTIVNLGTTAIYLALDRDVSSEKGLYLSASGGHVNISYDIDFDMVAWEWFAISETSANKVYIIAVVEV